MARPASVLTSVKSADALVFTGQAKIYWVLAAAGATGGLWQLVDGISDTSNDKLSGFAQASGETFILCDPPIQCDLGIYADIPGTNVTLTIGYR